MIDGKTIRKAREKKGWPVAQLAAEVFVTEATIRNYEAGRTTPDFRKAQAIAKVLGIEVKA